MWQLAPDFCAPTTICNFYICNFLTFLKFIYFLLFVCVNPKINTLITTSEHLEHFFFGCTFYQNVERLSSALSCQRQISCETVASVFDLLIQILARQPEELLNRAFNSILGCKLATPLCQIYQVSFTGDERQ